MTAPVRVPRVLAIGAVVVAGVAGALATVYGQDSPANRAVLPAARASGSLSAQLGDTGSPLPVVLGYFGSAWGLSLLGAAAAMLGLWAAWRVTMGCRGLAANVCRVTIVALAVAGIVGLCVADVRTALVVSIALAAWRYIQDFALRGMVQTGFYGGMLLAAAAAVQPSAAFWALAMAWACFLLPGQSRPRDERAAGALVVAFPGVAVACLWGVMRLTLGGTVRIEPPTPHPAAFAAAAFAGVLLWIALADTGAAGVGAATIPVLLAGSAGMLGPGVVTVAVPAMAVLSVVALTFAAHWALVRMALVGLAASVAMLGATSAAVGGTAAPATHSHQVAGHVSSRHATSPADHVPARCAAADQPRGQVNCTAR
jgi:hypothetical protein